MAELQKTPLYEEHLRLEGDMADYNGWLLPIRYKGIIDEVLQTRRKAGLFDLSHMGEFLVEGPRAAEFLQGVITNNIFRLYDGRVIYSPICDHDGGTIDDVLIYRYHEHKYLLVVNAANISGDYNWLAQKIIPGTNLNNISGETALVGLQGPAGEAILQGLTGIDLQKLPYYHFVPKADVAGIKVMISRTGYTGEDGFEIFCTPHEAPLLWKAINCRGEGLGLAPAGLGARDILRLEAALPLYGHELTANISPLEAGLECFVSFDKGPFVGREALWQKKSGGLSKRLAGLVLLDRGVPRDGHRVRRGGSEIGYISSGTYSPTLKESIAMSFLSPKSTTPGREVEVVIREKPHRAKVVKMPFYRRKSP